MLQLIVRGNKANLLEKIHRGGTLVDIGLFKCRGLNFDRSIFCVGRMVDYALKSEQI
jgi:hypothetical protein